MTIDEPEASGRDRVSEDVDVAIHALVVEERSGVKHTGLAPGFE